MNPTSFVSVAEDADAHADARLRILMVAPQPFFRARGTPFSVLHRIRALVHAGHRVDLITYPFGEDVDLPGLRIFRAAGVPFVRDIKIGPSVAKLLLDVPLYLATVRALRYGRYDVLHSHEEAAFFAVGLARKFGLVHVYDMHSSLPQQLSNFSAFGFRWAKGMFQRLERQVLQTCDGVITICPELGEIAQRECGETPHAMIENTADDRQVFGEDEFDARAQLSLRDSNIILYTGTFESYQGLDLLMRAFKRVRETHPRTHLIMVGGRPGQISEYKEQARVLGIETAMSFAGSIHPSQIPAYQGAADVIVSPRSKGSNTPLKIYGYMRSLRPLVATNLPTHTQVLDESIACLVPASEEGLAEGMRKVLDNPAHAKQLAESAAEHAERLFSDSSYLNKVAGFYRRVVNGYEPAGHELSLDLKTGERQPSMPGERP